MAKVTGPLFSTEASGSISKLLTFAKNKSTPQVRAHPRVRHLSKDCQEVVNNLFKQAIVLWKVLDQDEKDGWHRLAKIRNLPYNGYNLFIGHFIEEAYINTECWHLHHFPMPEPE